MANKETITAIYKLQDQMSKDLKTITKNMDEFNKEADENSKKTKQVGESFKGMGKWAVAGASALGAVGASMVAIKGLKFAHEVSQQANQVEKFSKSTTIASGTISSLATAVKKGGGEIDNVGDIVQDFTEKLGDAKSGSESYKEAFNALGVDISSSPQQALEQSIKALSEMDDQSAALFRGIELFGDSYKLISDQIAQGNNVLNQSPLFSGELIAASGAFARNTRQMGAELQVAVNQGMTPFMQGMSELVQMLDDSGMWDNFVGGVSTAVGWAEKLSGFMKDAVLALQQVALEKQQKELEKVTKRLAKVNDEVASSARRVEVINGQAVAFEVDKTALIKEQGELFQRRGDLIKEIEAREKNIFGLVTGGGDSEGGAVVTAIKKRTEAVKELEKAYKPIFDFQAGGAGVAPQGVSSDMPVPELSVMELKDRQREEELAKQQEFYEAMLQNSQSYVDSTRTLFDALFQSKLNNIDAEMQADIERVKVSKKSEKKKNEEIAKIEAAAARESLKIRQNQWRADLIQSVANTALSVSRTAQMGFPQAIPFMAAAGAAGAAQMAVIAANKPKFERGGIVGGASMTGDSVTARVNSGEMILNRQQQAQLFDIANGAGTTNNSNTYQITVNALDPQGAATAVSEALAYASENGMVDETRLSVRA